MILELIHIPNDNAIDVLSIVLLIQEGSHKRAMSEAPKQRARNQKQSCKP